MLKKKALEKLMSGDISSKKKKKKTRKSTEFSEDEEDLPRNKSASKEMVRDPSEEDSEVERRVSRKESRSQSKKRKRGEEKVEERRRSISSEEERRVAPGKGGSIQVIFISCPSLPKNGFCQVRLENRPESSTSGRLGERLLKLAGGRDETKERRRERSKERMSSERQSRRDHSEERRGRGGKRSPTEERRGKREESSERRSTERKGRRGESEEKRSRREASIPARKTPAKRSPSPVLKKSIRDRLGPSTNGSGGSPRPESRGVKDRLGGAVKEETRNGGRSKVGFQNIHLDCNMQENKFSISDLKRKMGSWHRMFLVQNCCFLSL